MKEMNAETRKLIVYVVIIAILGLIVWQFAREILEFLNLRPTRDEAQILKEETRQRKKSIKGAEAIQEKAAKDSKQGTHGKPGLLDTQREEIVKDIRASVGVIYDSPEKALSAIQRLITWGDYVAVNDRFKKAYGKDILSYLKYHFDTEEQKATFNDIVNVVSKLKKA